MLNVIITGASRGIGLAAATAFLDIPELKLGLIARNEKALTDFAVHHRKEGTEIIVLPFDFEKKTDRIGELATNIGSHFTRIDILINNAGMLIHKPFEAIEYDEYEQLLKVNFMAPGLLIRHLFPLLQHSKMAHVVNIASMGGYQGSVRFPGMSLYSASKAALANLTESLATEYNDEPIRFNCLALGAVQTEMLSEAFPDYNAPVQANEMGQYIRDFSVSALRFMNGKVIPLSLSTP